MEVAKKILEIKGYSGPEEMIIDEIILIKNPSHPDLMIEKIATNQMLVGHFDRKQGDLLGDPGVTFRIDDDKWVPVRFTRNPSMGRKTPIIHKHDENGLDDTQEFIEQWDEKLTRQGYIEAAKKEAK